MARFTPDFERGSLRPHPTNPSRYFGKICPKHPEDEGERRIKTAGCVSCQRERNKERNQRPEVMAAKNHDRREQRKDIAVAKKIAENQMALIKARACLMAKLEVGTERAWMDYYQRALDQLREQGKIPPSNT